MDGLRQRKKDATRNAIVDQAMALFEAEGYDAVTMERIAEAAQVAKATLYRYFPVKEAILAAFMRRANQDGTEAVLRMIAQVPGTRARLEALYGRAAQWFGAHPTYLERYLTYRLSQPRAMSAGDNQRSGFHHHLMAVLEAGLAEGDLRADLPLELLAGSLECLHLAIILSWLRDKAAPEVLEQSVPAMISVFLDGAARKDKP